MGTAFSSDLSTISFDLSPTEEGKYPWFEAQVQPITHGYYSVEATTTARYHSVTDVQHYTPTLFAWTVHDASVVGFMGRLMARHEFQAMYRADARQRMLWSLTTEKTEDLARFQVWGLYFNSKSKLRTGTQAPKELAFTFARFVGW